MFGGFGGKSNRVRIGMVRINVCNSFGFKKVQEISKLRKRIESDFCCIHNRSFYVTNTI